MTTTSSTSSTAKPLVDSAKMPKIKLSNEKLAHINAFACVTAIFFGIAAIFSAIAGFTDGEWSFNVPFVGVLFNNISEVSGLVVTAVLVLCAGIAAIMTVHKLTDAAAVKKAWGKVACVMTAVGGYFCVQIVGTIIYSLMSLGAKSVDQGDLWLSNFLPQLILLADAAIIFFIAKQINAGKTEMLRIANYLALGIAIVAFLLVFIQSMVGLYSKKSTTTFEDFYRNLTK